MAISRVSVAVNNSNTVVLGPHQENDTIIVFAFNNSTSTYPLLPTGFISVAAFGALNQSFHVGWKRAASSAETIGTWTGAQTIHALVYRPSANKIIVPYSVSGQQASLATVTIPAQAANTFPSGVDDYWLLAFIAMRSVTNSLETATWTGLTNAANSISGVSYQVVSNDSNSTRSAIWTAQTATVATSALYLTRLISLTEIATQAGGGGGVLVSLNPPLSPYKFSTFSNGGITSSSVLTAGGKVGFVFEAPKSGVIDRIVWYSGTATGSPTVDLRVETVSGSAPSGTLWATNTNAITGTLATNTEYETTLTAGANVTKGDLIGISWNYNSGTSIGIGFNPTVKSLGSFLNTPQINTAGSWATVAGRATRCLLRYQDGTYALPNVDSVAYGTVALTGFFSTGEKGILFQLPYKARLTGVWMQSDVRSDITLKLYDSSTSPGGTALLSKIFPSGSLPAVGTAFNEFYFSNTRILDANTQYRLVAEFGAGTGTRYNLATFGSSERRDAVVNNQYYTESSGAAWVNTLTQVPVMGLIIDQIDDGATGSGGVFDPLNHPLIN